MTNKKHNYDWDAMGFDPDEGDVEFVFVWGSTPQGHDWWADNEFTPEGQAEFARMKRLYAEDMAAKAGPVRTVTTRRVANQTVIGHVEVTKRGKVWMRHTDDPATLRAAAETLIQIAKALEGEE